MSEAKKSSKSASSKQIMDVAHPGKSAPTATSKPVIITNRPILKDPMMVDDDADADKPESDKPDTSKGTPIKVSTGPGKIKLQPITAEAVKIKTDHDEDEAEISSPAPTEAAAEPDSKEIATETPDKEPAVKATTDDTDSKEDVTPAEATEEADNKDKSAADKPSTKAAAVPPSDDAAKEPDDETADPQTEQTTAELDAKEAEEAAKHEVAIQEITDSKKYYLPVNSVEKRRTKRVVILGILISVLLALAWVDVALDAGLVHVDGVKPVTHFFSN